LACLVEVRVDFIEIIVRLHFCDWLSGAFYHDINRTITRYV
jgi:hypothetical protein